MNTVAHGELRRRGVRGLLASFAIVVGLLVAAPGAESRRAVNLSLDVTFSATGTISVALPDGTPVGSTSGPPTVIPAGFYTVVLTAPGGCTDLPYFHLQGPGNNILDNMDDGELANNSDNANLLPNSTYSWSNDSATPLVVHTFTTSGSVVGTAPTGYAAASGVAAGNHGSATSHDLVGSAAQPTRGTLAGAVSAAGQLTLAYNGRSVTSLKAGRYTITVTDKSSASGFMLQATSRHAPVALTGAAFVGTRSASVDLTAGTWSIASPPGRKPHSFIVN